MGGSNEDDYNRGRRSRKHDGSGRSKHRSSRDSGRRKDRDRDCRDRASRKRDTQEDGDCRPRDSSTFTEEEARLYDKARKYIEQEKHDVQRPKRSGDADDGDAHADRERKRPRSHKEHKKSSRKEKKHTRDRRDDDRFKNKDSKEKQSHKKHGSKSAGSFRDKASPIAPSKLVSLGEAIGEPPAEKLDADDYFSHNVHLRIYLYRTFAIYFEELTSSESHDAFTSEFVKAYNTGHLEKAYYDPSGLFPQAALDQCSRTKHQWNFRTNTVEKQSLSIVRAGVKKQTEYNEKGGTAHTPATQSLSYPITRAKIGPQPSHVPPTKTPQQIALQRQADKQHRERINLANEEMYGVGKADPGRDRQREKRREQSEKLHGAAQDRESAAWGGAELDDAAIYGTGSGAGRKGGRGEPSYEQAVAKRSQYRARKDAEKAARTAELLQKEEEKQANMLAMLGLSGLKAAGQKIKILPRNDNA